MFKCYVNGCYSKRRLTLILVTLATVQPKGCRIHCFELTLRLIGCMFFGHRKICFAVITEWFDKFVDAVKVSNKWIRPCEFGWMFCKCFSLLTFACINEWLSTQRFEKFQTRVFSKSAKITNWWYFVWLVNTSANNVKSLSMCAKKCKNRKWHQAISFVSKIHCKFNCMHATGETWRIDY